MDIKNSKIYSLSTKLPKINKVVYMISHNFKTMGQGTLNVYTGKEGLQNSKEILRVGDIFWHCYNYEAQVKEWIEIDRYPYWIETKDVLNAVIPDKLNRFQLMDLSDEV